MSGRCLLSLPSFYLPFTVFYRVIFWSPQQSKSESLSLPLPFSVSPSPFPPVLVHLSLRDPLVSFLTLSLPPSLPCCSVCLSPGGPESAGDRYVSGGAGGLHHPPLAGQHAAGRPGSVLHRRGAPVSGQEDGGVPTAAHPGGDPTSKRDQNTVLSLHSG